MKLGCIGDDFTGSSDLANTLAKQGMRTVQYTGIPSNKAAPDVEAGVISLKSRSIPKSEAIRLSLMALDWLREQGCEQFFFKYCSTFDSTPLGNIGPVADALADALNAKRVVVCPAFPATGRSVYQGHLFVNDTLLSESGLEHHPLNPMTDPDIRRWLARQAGSKVGHVGYSIVAKGADAIREALDQGGVGDGRLIVVDAVQDSDLMAIGAATKGLVLVTGGSGVALGLPANFGCVAGPVPWRGQAGRAVALSGSCSRATRAQVRHHAETAPAKEVRAAEIIDGVVSPADAVDWALGQSSLPLIYSSADPDVVATVQSQFGRERAAEAIEGFFAETARRLVDAGITRLISAGGETSGAVVEGLGLAVLEIGPEIDPGVPALRGRDDLVIALKSGNFGGANFFSKADTVLRGSA